MKITTWNVNSLNARLEFVLGWLKLAQPDVLCIQETKLKQDTFPHDDFTALGYESVHYGQGQWNGVAIISKVGIHDTEPGFADGHDEDPQARLIWATCGEVRIASAYIPNGRELGHEHYHYKLAWFQRLEEKLQTYSPEEPLVIVGDFNVAPTDLDIWDTKAFRKRTHVSEPEREAWQKLCDWGLHDVFRQRYPDIPGLFTFWDYQAGSFHQRRGMRIDHILATNPLSEKLEWVLLDRNARKNRGDLKPSDHAPLTAEFAGY